MGAAYFIALDNPAPGFDPFVSGKAIARDAKRIAKFAASVGCKSPDDFVSMSSEGVADVVGDFDLGDVALPPEQWFDADEGLAWVMALRRHLQSDTKAVKDADAVLADLDQYEHVLSQAKAVGAKWHLSVDF